MKRWLYFPLLILIAAFLVDKAFFVGHLPYYFLRSLSYINYDHKITMTIKLRNYLRAADRKKVVVLFGNSRTLSFDTAYLEKTYPDWILFNYSVPGGTSDYYYYYMKRFQEENIRPEAIFFAISPQGFNYSPLISMDETMINGLPLSFVAAHAGHFRLQDLTNYAAKKTMWTYRYRPNLDTIRYRLRNQSEFMYDLKQFEAIAYNSLIINRGSTPYNDHAEPDDDPDFWEKTALQTFKNFFEPYQLHPGMISFTQKSLQISQELGAKTILLWPRIAPELRRLKMEKKVRIVGLREKETIHATWFPMIEKLSRDHQAPVLNLNLPGAMKCDKFYDASHMASVCFAEFSDRIFETLRP